MRHLFLKLKVMRWKGDQKESEFQPNAIGIEKEPKSLKCEENGITIKTEMLQKKKKKTLRQTATNPTTNTLHLLHIKTKSARAVYRTYPYTVHGV